jgi:hypothetical protein
VARCSAVVGDSLQNWRENENEEEGGPIHEEELERVELTEIGNGSGVLCEMRCGGGGFLMTHSG